MLTALITGASTFTWLEFVKVFLAKKSNLVLLAGSGDKLNDLAA